MAQTSGQQVTIGNATITSGSGAPTGVYATQGSLYINASAASTTTRLYINTTGSSVWTAFTSAA